MASSVITSVIRREAPNPTTPRIMAMRADSPPGRFSPAPISEVTNAVVAEVTAWQARPLDALEAASPKTTLQTRLVHLIRRSLDLVEWRDRNASADAADPRGESPGASA